MDYQLMAKIRGEMLSENQAHLRLPLPLARFSFSIVSVPVIYE